LDLLPEIGPVLAQRIVAYRNAFGDFESIEDLLRVNGIGEKTLDKIRDYITV
jgi:competence protein ComEA